MLFRPKVYERHLPRFSPLAAPDAGNQRDLMAKAVVLIVAEIHGIIKIGYLVPL